MEPQLIESADVGSVNDDIHVVIYVSIGVPIRACCIDIVAMFSKIGPHVSRQSLGVDVLRKRVVSGRAVPVINVPPSIVTLRT